MRKGHCRLFCPIKQKSERNISRYLESWGARGGEPDELVEVGEKAGDESEGTDTERDIPEGEDEEEGD